MFGHHCAMLANTITLAKTTKFKRGIAGVWKKLRTHAGWDWSGVDHSGTIGLWWAAANASLLTFHQSDNMFGTNPAVPTAYNQALNSRSQRRRRTFYTQSGDFWLPRCTCVRSWWICRYGEQGNGAAPRDARAASFRESARSSRKRRTMRVAGASGRSRYAWIQIRTKQRFKSEVPGQSIQNLSVNCLKANEESGRHERHDRLIFHI